MDSQRDKRLSRRDFIGLSAGLATASAFALSGCSSSSTVKTSGKVVTPPKGLSKIDHVIIIMQENRSFDHYYGTFPGVIGFEDAIKHHPETLAQPFSANTTASPVGKLLPFHFNTQDSYAACVGDIDHSWYYQHVYWAKGALTGFGLGHLKADGAVAGRNAMGYYTRSDLGFYHDLAENFTICDSYHCAVIGPTHPNRVMSIAASIDPEGLHGGPILRTRSDLAYEGSVEFATMPERLLANSVSWKFYEPRGSLYQVGTSIGAITSDNPLLYFKQFVSDTSSELYKLAFTPSYPTDLYSDIENDNLPNVSWVNLALTEQEHPPAPPLGGMKAVYNFLQVLWSNPKVWEKTVVFITYDENGGFFDHVNPPTAPPGTKDEYIKNPKADGADGIKGPIGLGFRVPMLVISPFSQGGYISRQICDHTSILRFLETRFNVEVPNLSAWRRATTGDLTNSLDLDLLAQRNPSLPSPPRLSQPPASLLPVDESTFYAGQTYNCDIGTVLGNEPPYPIPNPQSLPIQKKGASKLRPLKA